MSAIILDKKSFTPLYFQLKEFLKGEILSRRLLPGMKLLPEPELAKKYGISRVTARKALQELKKEKLLVQFPAKGTFIAELPARPVHEIFALIIPTHGHVHENQSGAIIRRLQEQSKLTLVVDSSNFQSNPKQQENILKNIIEKNISGIVVDGVGIFPFELLKKFGSSIGKVVFINKCEHDYQDAADFVLSDIEEGARLATEHLIQTGRRNIMLNIHDPVIIKRKIRNYEHTDHFLFIAGYRKAMQESGLEPIISYIDPVGDEACLNSLLTGTKRPNAILASSDFRALKIINICRNLGIEIPEDLAVVGYYNTPWSRYLDTTITSVSIKEEIIAKKVSCLLLNEKKTGKTCKISIKPELIIRKSSGATSDILVTKN